MSMVFENVGASAYLGSAQFLANNADYLTAAGVRASYLLVVYGPSLISALLVHSGYRGAPGLLGDGSRLEAPAMERAVRGSSHPQRCIFAGRYGPSPLAPNSTLIRDSTAPFIKSCPPTNAPLPVKPFPALTLSSSSPARGGKITATFSQPQGAANGGAFVAWLDGRQVLYTALDKNGSTQVPETLMGTVYAAVVKSKETPDDDNMLTGFTVAQFPFDSKARTNV